MAFAAIAPLLGSLGSSAIGGISNLGSTGIDAVNRLQLQSREQDFTREMLERRIKAFTDSGLPESSAFLSGGGGGSSLALESRGIRILGAGYTGPWLAASTSRRSNVAGLGQLVNAQGAIMPSRR
uniref:VP2 n=1 Tax=Wuhan spiny eel calicivirus 2 TaxID=2116157 RepID=A0A2P1GMJ2_9CALI|nr:VP2 [Wuhan spiny eel calicivirus 2]